MISVGNKMERVVRIISIVLILNPVICMSVLDLGWKLFNVISEGLYDIPRNRLDPEVYMNVVRSL